ncbi:MAG: SIS domain-containing protein [Polyangiales bacterium]
MGGIFAATARHDVIPRVVGGLAGLAHLGPDSAGLGVLADRQIRRRRVEGEFSLLESLLAAEPLVATTAIGHVRQATHGDPALRNAHPHASSRVAIVHTGVVENHRELRSELERDGVQFRSDTDSEVIVWLLDRELARRTHPMRALQRVLPRLRGSQALSSIFAQYDDRVYAARLGEGLAVGRSDDAAWLASDLDSVGRYAQESALLRDGQIAELQPGQVRLFDLALERCVPQWNTRARRPHRKSGAMISDAALGAIMAQPSAVAAMLQTLERDIGSNRLEPWCGPLSRAQRILAVGGGTAYHSAHIGRGWFERIAGIPAEVELISELETRSRILGDQTIALVIPDSRDDEEALEALRRLKRWGVPTVALTDMGSGAIAREADATIGGHAAKEGDAPLAESFTTQLAALAAASIAIRYSRSGQGRPDGATRSIFAVPRAMEAAFALTDECAQVGQKIAEAGHAIYLGRGMNHPLAHMGADRLEALARLPADGFAGGELRHRFAPRSRVRNPVVVVAPSDENFGKTLADTREIVARGGQPTLVGDSESATLAKGDDLPCLAVERVDPVWSPLLLSIPLQLLAYHAARALNRISDSLVLRARPATAR